MCERLRFASREMRRGCGGDHDEFNHSNNAALARTSALNPDSANGDTRDRSGNIMGSTAHAAGGARHCKGRQNPSKGSAHSGVSMSPVCSTNFGSSISTTSTRGAEIA